MTRTLVLVSALLVARTAAMKVRNVKDASLLETGSLPFQDKIFKIMDTDKDGFISAKDLKRWHFSDTADILMQIADSNKDGKLNALEFFGTVSAGPKVPGDPGSGDVPWHKRNFDPVLDTENGDEKTPTLCTKEFWQWAADEWRQRKVANTDNNDIKAGMEDYFFGGNQEGWNARAPAQFLMRQLSELVAGWDRAWDVCLNILPLQKRFKLGKDAFVEWKRCYHNDLDKLYQEHFSDIKFTGVPADEETREKIAKFYENYYVNEQQTCGMSAADRKQQQDMWPFPLMMPLAGDDSLAPEWMGKGEDADATEKAAGAGGE